MPTPEPESNGKRSEAKTPEQKTFAYRLGRVVQLGVFPILGFGIFVAILSFVAHRLFDPDDADLIVVGTLFCVLVVGMFALTWWCGDRIERYFKIEHYFKRKPAEAPGSIPKKGLPFWEDWKTFVALAFLIAMMRAADPYRQPQRPEVFKPTPQSIKAIQQLNSGLARPQRQRATLAYWQTAVANLHQIRFQTPAGNEAAGRFVADAFKRLKKLTELARAAPTADLDQDLVTMARRHLVVEDRWIQFKADVDELMNRDKIPADTVAVGQRITEWQSIVARIQADPSMLDSLPQSPERTLLENALELEQQRLDQLREIEIMQAVLQERYPRTKFPLPEVAQ